MSFWIDGILASEHLDSSGEILSVKGCDISSLHRGEGIINFEHESKLPTQVLGRVVKAKKIFSPEDCEDDRMEYYWEKCGVPYIYILGELFDSEVCKHVISMFEYSDKNKNPDSVNVLGFSIEGSKLKKEGQYILESIARKATLTVAPCNKSCNAELVPNQSAEKDSDVDSIFKSEPSFTIELLDKSEQLEKAQVPGSKIAPAHAPAGKYTPVKGLKGWRHEGGGNFTHAEHGTVSVGKQPDGKFNVRHSGRPAGIGSTKEPFSTMAEAGAHAKKYMGSLSQGKSAPAHIHDRASPQMPKMDKAMTAGSGMGAPQTLTGGAALAKEDILANPVPGNRIKRAAAHKARGDSLSHKIAIEGAKEAHKEKLQSIKSQPKPNLGKALTRDHYGPATSTGHEKGVHTNTEFRETSKKMAGTSDAGHSIGLSRDHKFSDPLRTQLKQDAVKEHKRVLGELKSMPKPNLGKSELLKRAEQEYAIWAKREEFENFMAKTMPNLTKSEIKIIGQALALRKSMAAEKKLAKLMANSPQESFLNKKDKK